MGLPAENSAARLRGALLIAGAAAAIAYVLYWAWIMGGTSLVTDEFGTVSMFSSHGPFRVMTHYEVPKNHVFFNLVNSVIPWNHSYDPWRERFISMAAVLATVIVVVRFFARNRLYLAAYLFLGAWAVNPETHLIMMQARGYGFLGLFAALSLIFIHSWIDKGEERSFIGLCVCTVLGIYTVPTYLFFGAPVMACAWLMRPDRRMFFAGAISALAVLVLYLPIALQVYSAFHHYSETLDKTFGSLFGLKIFIHAYVFPKWISASQIWMLLGAMTLGVALLWRDRTAFRFALCAFFGCVVFFAYCFWQKSIPMRTAQFIAVDTAMLLGYLCDKNIVQRLPGQIPALLIELVACIVLFWNVAWHFQIPRPLPLEDWFLVKRTEEFLQGPSGAVGLDETLPNENTKNFRFVADKRTRVDELKNTNYPREIIIGARHAWSTDKVEFQILANDTWDYVTIPSVWRTIYVEIPVRSIAQPGLPMTIDPAGSELTIGPLDKGGVAGFHFFAIPEKAPRVEEWNGSAWTPADFLVTGDSVLVRAPSGNTGRIRIFPGDSVSKLILNRLWVSSAGCKTP